MQQRRTNNDDRFGETRAVRTYHVERGLTVEEFPDSFRLTYTGPLALRDAKFAISVLRQYEPTAQWRIADENEEAVKE